jgi:hypothetical protein
VGKWQQRGREQDAKVGPVQEPVHEADAAERRVMVEPHDPHVVERCDVGKVARPLRNQSPEQAAWWHLRRPQVQHQQGNHDGQHAVECLYPGWYPTA